MLTKRTFLKGHWQSEVSSAAEEKKSKLRLLCCNSTATDKLHMLIIGKSKNPRCFKGCSFLPCEYEGNKKAWMTKDIFSKWLMELGHWRTLQIMRKNKKIPLLIDNWAAHKAALNLKNVRVEFFPPNFAIVLQPLDLGIIRSLKANYYKEMLHIL